MNNKKESLLNWMNKLNGTPVAVVGLMLALSGAWFVRERFTRLETDHQATLAELEQAQEKNYELIKMLGEKDGVINAFEGQIGDIASTVGTLEKLSQTDEELLKKYSKVYFLNENYIPSKLVQIDYQYRNPGATNYYIHGDVWPHLKQLLSSARDNDLDLLVASAYRSFSTQSSLKNTYTVTYGSGANSFSADQGYSEHQLGTALDFTTKKLGSNFNPFASDPAYQWLLKNAYRFGFILSYPQNNKYYVFEPWHWRFVGVKLATYLHEEKKSFYDLDQREIDKYLVTLFD